MKIRDTTTRTVKRMMQHYPLKFSNHFHKKSGPCSEAVTTFLFDENPIVGHLKNRAQPWTPCSARNWPVSQECKDKGGIVRRVSKLCFIRVNKPLFQSSFAFHIMWEWAEPIDSSGTSNSQSDQPIRSGQPPATTLSIAKPHSSSFSMSPVSLHYRICSHLHAKKSC